MTEHLSDVIKCEDLYMSDEILDLSLIRFTYGTIRGNDLTIQP